MLTAITPPTFSHPSCRVWANDLVSTGLVGRTAHSRAEGAVVGTSQNGTYTNSS